MIRSLAHRYPLESTLAVLTALTAGFHTYKVFFGNLDDWAYNALASAPLPCALPTYLIAWAVVIGCYLAYKVGVPAVKWALAPERTLRRRLPSMLEMGVVVVVIAVLASVSGPMVSSITEQGDGMGYSVGGARDINTFRDNLANNTLPQSSSITSEGLFHEYFFDTGARASATHLFEPTYTTAVSRDPVTKQPEHYLAVGLNSNLNTKTFERKKLNLVVVLDVSGSMHANMNEYYYDQNKPLPVADVGDPDAESSKLTVALKAVCGLTRRLREGDRFGMAVFNSGATVVKPMRLVERTDLDAIRGHIMDLTAYHGTDMSAGLETGRQLLDPYVGADADEYENRLIFLTDAQPNCGAYDNTGLLDMTTAYASQGVYLTFVGIGVDFGTTLVEAISKVRGANYCAVHSSSEFKRRLDAEFDYLVTPMVFDLCLSVKSEGYTIERVYGSPEADEATGELMRVKTLFPAPMSHGETKGGLVLLRLRQESANPHLSLSVSYEDRTGRRARQSTAVRLLDKAPDNYDNSGIRKGIVLARYVDLMQHWCDSERGLPDVPSGKARRKRDNRTDWEQTSLPLVVNDANRTAIQAFAEVFERETKEIGDPTLETEQKVLAKLAGYGVRKADLATPQDTRQN